MISMAGTVWGSSHTSHLYAIFKGKYVYFGETGHVPAVRWKSHLTSKTDFLGRLAELDMREAASPTPIFFVGIHLACADDEPLDKQKIARRAVEAELHRRFVLNPSDVSPASHLLSEAPEAPVRHKFKFDKNDIATQVYLMIGSEFRRWNETMGINIHGSQGNIQALFNGRFSIAI